jgi:ABC-type lipoprotein export system ATPase subunit
MGLGAFLERRPSQLSGGQQQRVSIARAVANHPLIILAEVFEDLARREGLTIVMVTHERSFAARASRQLVLSDGQVIADVDQRAQAG